VAIPAHANGRLMLTVASLLWEPNEKSLDFSRCYSEEWVHRLYAGFARNLTRPFRFVLFTDRERGLPEEITQERLKSATPDYSTCIEPYRFGVPMILVGLDTVITGNIDHLADYCLSEKTIALPRDPYSLERACNGVALIPAGQQYVYRNWRGENDMEWMRRQPHVFIDDLFPKQVVSYKGSVRNRGLGDARIVYFHGAAKPHQLQNVDWIKQHWGGPL
jgi:hypothetical protein